MVGLLKACQPLAPEIPCGRARIRGIGNLFTALDTVRFDANVLLAK